MFRDALGLRVLDPKGRLKDAMFRITAGKMEKTRFAYLLRALPVTKQP